MRNQFVVALMLLTTVFALCLASCGGGDANTTQTVASGNLDPNFATGGVLKAQFANTFFLAAGLAIQSDGKILVPGSSWDGTTGGYALVRYNQNGNLDQQFGTNGKTTALPGPNGGSINGIAVQPAGNIVVVGQSYNGTDNDIDILRFLADGTLDSAWGNRGQLISSVGTNEIAYGLAIQLDGKVVVVGSASNGSDSDFLVVRFNTDGTLDDTFGVHGVVKTPVHPGFAQAFYASAQRVSIQNDGKIIVAGSVNLQQQFSAQNQSVLARYKADGTLDVSFGTGGLVTAASGFITSMVLQHDGNICINVFQDSGFIDNEIWRYTSDGLLDQTFGQNGSVGTSPTGVTDLLQDSQGRLVAIGGNWASNKVEIVRYRPDGTIDLSFGTSGKASSSQINYGPYISLVIQRDGKLLAAGSTTDPAAGTLLIQQFVP